MIKKGIIQCTQVVGIDCTQMNVLKHEQAFLCSILSVKETNTHNTCAIHCWYQLPWSIITIPINASTGIEAVKKLRMYVKIKLRSLYELHCN